MICAIDNQFKNILQEARGTASIEDRQRVEAIADQPSVAPQEAGTAQSAFELYRAECWELIRTKQALWWSEIPGETKANRMTRFHKKIKERWDDLPDREKSNFGRRSDLGVRSAVARPSRCSSSPRAQDQALALVPDPEFRLCPHQSQVYTRTTCDLVKPICSVADSACGDDLEKLVAEEKVSMHPERFAHALSQ